MSAARVVWARGGEGELSAFDGERAEVLSSTPAAPGTPLKGAIGDEARALELKVHGCKRVDDGRFAVRGRVVNLTRDLRALLQSLVTPPTSTPAR